MVNQKKYQANLRRQTEKMLERIAPTTQALAMVTTARDDHDRVIKERDDALEAVHHKFAKREQDANRELADAVASARKKMTATDITEMTELSATRQRELLDLLKNDGDDDEDAANDATVTNTAAGDRDDDTSATSDPNGTNVAEHTTA